MGGARRVRRCRAISLALAAGLAFGCGAEPNEPAGEGWMSAADRALGAVVSPGTLANAHAHLEGVSACAECHAGLSGTPDARCTDCHRTVSERRAGEMGFHGGLEGACRGCHVEHRGPDADLLGLDREAFNHDLALFALRGAHRMVDCADCHTRVDPDTGRPGFHPLGIGHATCATCHDGPHGEALQAGRDCAACHGEDGWGARFLVPAAEAAREPAFDHGHDTRFALEGAHARVECASCHTSARGERAREAGLAPGRGLPAGCAGCHDDVHEGALGAQCTSCHVAAAWKGPEAVFDHQRHTDFSLDALHARLACSSCHADARFDVAGSRCADCHADAAALLSGRFEGASSDADPHAGRVECRGCHPAGLGNPRLLDYERRCIACHAAEYGQLLLTRRRILDDAVVRTEAALRRTVLARRRGEPAGDADPAAVAGRLERLAGTGLHNPDLAEARLHALLQALGEPGGPAWTN